MSFPVLEQATELSAALASEQHDAVLLVADFSQALPAPFADIVAAAKQHDQRVGEQALLVQHADMPGQRLICAPTGALVQDYDDVRSVFDAAATAASIASAAGAKKLLLVTAGLPQDERFQDAAGVAYLGACQALYQPLEAREALGEDSIETVTQITVLAEQLNIEWLQAVEAGKRVARDLAGTEPERMAPKKFAEYCRQAFAHTAVKVTVVDDVQQLQHEYPLLSAVGRASLAVERHRPCVIRLEYHAAKPQRTLLFAGKGIVYDTGGADLKVGGHMAGMSRDKGGAAAVAGFVKTVAGLAPEDTSVIAEIGAVRNSIGADAFVADEIITAHSGKRVRIGNTDAEGRLVLADLLSHLREDALQSDAPQLFSVATLTGHAALAKGPYTALVPNASANLQQLAEQLFSVGEVVADPTEISWSRREDFHFVRPRTKADDVLSSNNGPSATTARGHQFPMAFLTIAAGLDAHNARSEKPLPYIHIDIAGSGVEGGDWQHGKPTAAPVTCLSACYLTR